MHVHLGIKGRKRNEVKNVNKHIKPISGLCAEEPYKN